MAAPDTVAPSPSSRCSASMPHVGLEAESVVHEHAHRHVDAPGACLRAPTPAPGRPATRRACRRASSTAPGRPAAATGRRPWRVTTRLSVGRSGSPVIGERSRARRPTRRRTGTDAHRLDIHGARQVQHVVRGAARARLRRSETVASCRIASSNCWLMQHVHHVDERQADEQHGDRERDADNRDERADGLTFEVAQHHSRRHRQAQRCARTGCGGSSAGGSGRMASAGGMRTARRTADQAPSAATTSAPTSDSTATSVDIR